MWLHLFCLKINRKHVEKRLETIIYLWLFGSCSVRICGNFQYTLIALKRMQFNASAIWFQGSITAMTVFFPLDTIRSRLQIEDNRRSKDTLTMIKELIEEEGLWVTLILHYNKSWSCFKGFLKSLYFDTVLIVLSFLTKNCYHFNECNCIEMYLQWVIV